MNNENEKKEIKKPSDPKLERILGFITLDVIALICFGFGGANGLNFLRVIGFSVALFLLPYFRYHFAGVKKSKLPILPLVALFFLGISYFWMTYYTGAIVYGILFNLIVSLGFIAMFCLGSSLRELSDLTKEYIALAILGALALLVLVTGFYSLIRYGFFYAAINNGKVYYFDGVVFPIASEGKLLDGFMFREVNIAVAKAPAFILACSAVGLFAMDYKKRTWRLPVLIGFTAIGLLDLIFTPYRLGLILLLVVYVVMGIHQLIQIRLSGEENRATRDKIAKIVFFVLLGLAGVVILVLFVDTMLGASSFLRKIPLFYAGDKPKTFGVAIDKIENAIEATFFTVRGETRQGFNFLTTLFGANAVDASGTRLMVYNTHIFEFDILYQNGLVGFAGLMFLIFFGFYYGHRFLINEDGGPKCQRMAFMGILLGIFVYFSFNNDEIPLLHAYGLDEFFSYHSSLLVPLSRSSFFLLAALLLGYIYEPKEKAEPSKKEEACVNE